MSASASALGGRRLGVGHLEDRGDAAQHRAARAALEILLPLEARLAEMDLAVDDAGQDGAARVASTISPAEAGAEIADGGEAAVADADVGPAAAGMAHHLAAADDQVEGLRHGGGLVPGGPGDHASAAADDRARGGRSTMWQIGRRVRGSTCRMSSNDRGPRTATARRRAPQGA